MNARAPLAPWRDALRDSDLDVRTKCVGHTIATYWNGRGLAAFPSKRTLARGAGVSERFVFKAIGELEARGFLHVDRSKGRSSNRYDATLPTVHPGSTVDDAPSVHGSPLSTMHDGAPNHARSDSQPCTQR